MSASASRLRSAECRCRAEWACAPLIWFLSTGALSTPPSKGGAQPPAGACPSPGGPRWRVRPPAAWTRPDRLAGWRRPTATGSGITTAPRAADARHHNDRRAEPTPARPFTDARPLPTTVRTTSTFNLPTNHLPSPPPRRFTHRSPPHRSPGSLLPCSDCRRTAPPQPAAAWADPPGLPGRSRKGRPAQRVGPPSSQSPGGKRSEHGYAGRGLFALKANTKKRTPRDEPQETNRSRPGQE
jgi:hypothetical protein